LLNTRRRVLILDKFATALITVVGLSVILAVTGMMAFLISSSWPLFESEKFTAAGELKTTGSAAGLLVDDVAPLAVLLPPQSNACRVQAQLIQPPNQKSDEGTAWNFNYAVTRSSPAGENPVWSLNPLSSQAAPQNSDDTVLCRAINNGQLLVRTGQTLTSASVQIVREFLSAEDVRALPTATKTTLTNKRWLVTPEGAVLVKASAQSPIAKLGLQIEGHWELPNFFAENPKLTLEDLNFLSRPGKKDGLLILRTATLEGMAQKRFMLLSISENAITGEKTTHLKQIYLQQLTSDTLSQSERNFPAAWIQDRHVVLYAGNNSFVAFDSEDANLSSTSLVAPVNLGRVMSWTPAFGGAAALTEFRSEQGTSGAQQRCAYLDIGRAIRLASAAANSTSEIPELWRDTCRSAVRTVAHPHKRVAFRITQESEKSALTLEARELTTGRIAAEKDLPAGADLTLESDSHGQLVSWFNNTSKTVELWRFNAPHVEVSLKSLFNKIHYESYETASYSWQSTSGTDEFQSKFSLVPLIWGTFKATLYSLLFAVPLAIFAAVYSSEILDRQTRNVVKPTLEMMASVPSVVLGFLAAIIVAPWVEAHIVSVLLIGTSMPFLLYVFGVFLQIPSARHLTTRGLYASRRLLMWVVLGFGVMLWLLIRAGLLIERTAFGGDLKAFLSGGPGTEGVLWGMLLLPLVFISLWSLPVSRARNLFRIAVFVLAPVLAVGVGSLLSGHTELRSDLLGQYAQRNTLVIAIAMGFAIIPIIYSLAEDALTAVPGSLRAGSLACGASVWQTTARVVLPTAASGIFSAIMVGLGRGIGETMIAVMATGNTAVMTTNPFDGLRSMAANIAVELPEAAQGSTHYRILFLSALTLFLFTFTLNSFAEFLRARYRARNKAL